MPFENSLIRVGSQNIWRHLSYFFRVYALYYKSRLGYYDWIGYCLYICIYILINEGSYIFVRSCSSISPLSSFFLLKRKTLLRIACKKYIQHYTKKKCAYVRIYLGQYSTRIIFFLSLTLHVAQSITVLKITNKKLVHVRIIFFWIFYFILFFFSSLCTNGYASRASL